MGVKSGIERIDTNIIVRLITRDIPEQVERAEKLILNKDKLFVFEDAAMMEVVFVLSSGYNFTRTQIVNGIKAIMKIENLACNKSIIEASLDVFVTHPKLSFVDCYLAITADTTQEIPLWTFDRKLISQCPLAREP